MSVSCIWEYKQVRKSTVVRFCGITPYCTEDITFIMMDLALRIVNVAKRCNGKMIATSKGMNKESEKIKNGIVINFAVIFPNYTSLNKCLKKIESMRWI